MEKINNDILREVYIEKLTLAKGDLSINNFARLAGISAGNFCRMLKGQAAKPNTLKKVAEARPDLRNLYEELMYAAGYTGETTYRSKVSAQTRDEASAEVTFLPVLDSLKGPKSKLLVNNLSERYLFSQKSLKNSKCFIFHTPDNALAPHIKEGDMVIFDLKKTPRDGDIVLFRIRKEEGLVRYYRKVNSKLIAYAASPDFPPDYFSKNDAEVLGVAVKAILNL